MFASDANGQQLRIVASYGEDIQRNDVNNLFLIDSDRSMDGHNHKYRKKVGAAGYAFLTGQRIIEPNLDNHKRELDQGTAKQLYEYKIQGGEVPDESLIEIPIVSSDRQTAGKIIGVWSISSTQEWAFTDADIALASTFAKLLGAYAQLITARGQALTETRRTIR